jgi:hypothetical protein
MEEANAVEIRTPKRETIDTQSLKPKSLMLVATGDQKTDLM